MAPRRSQQKAASSKPSLVKLDAAVPGSGPKRLDPLTAFKRPGLSLKSDGHHISSQGRAISKGKAREDPAVATQNSTSEAHGNRMWVDIYEPTTEAELAVHKKKVQDVRTWLDEAFDGGPSGKLVKYRRLLALLGPAGTAKTSTIRVLAKQMGFEILEWRNAMGESSSTIFGEPSDGTFGRYPLGDNSPDTEALFSKFEAFLNRASSCQSIFSVSETASPSHSQSSITKSRRIILLDDLPNILHPGTQAQFHAALQSLVASPTSFPPVPIVIIVSDAGMRGEASDERLANGGWAKSNEGVVDIRTVLPRELLHGPYVTQISFNPIAPSLLTKALQALLSSHYSSSSQTPPSRDVIDTIVETSNGDIRSAIMALQFACVVQLGGKRRKKKAGDETSLILESVTRREQSLVLFHLMGKVLYNKRKGDPSSTSASAKDIQREKLMDELLKDPPRLPRGLEQHERRASRVDVNTLYSDSPIDSSLFSLYIHQNYTQFCDDMDSCEGVADWLSWVDCSGGEAWYQANPHQFHLLTLGTLHSLPSPVPRRSQKVFKPAFFDYLQKEKNAWEAVRDAQSWVLGEETSQTLPANTWSQATVAVELGGVLKARDVTTAGKPATSRAPPSHRLFSHMKFSLLGSCEDGRSLGEREMGSSEGEDKGDIDFIPKKKEEASSWLDDDDIEDF